MVHILLTMLRINVLNLNELCSCGYQIRIVDSLRNMRVKSLAIGFTVQHIRYLLKSNVCLLNKNNVRNIIALLYLN